MDASVPLAPGAEHKKTGPSVRGALAGRTRFLKFLLVSDLLFDHALFHLLRLSVDEGSFFDPDAA